MRKIIPESDISADCYRKYADWHCTGLRAKKILDKMNLLNAPHATVLREGMQKQILSEELVKDDIVVLRAGDRFVPMRQCLREMCRSMNRF